ncbi:MAG TPA: SAM-dependent methyltransferase [Alphaproteobacteria bacterium]|nr:SAM-dependent methyltransferase [Alphaproteobacteria bacterium]HAJ48451.1 SAM-dependent methyltransferase [Alphaproteobacteria bacterium]
MQTVRLESLRLKPGAWVLDLGCGAGRHLHALYYSTRTNGVGVDLGFEDVVRTRQGFEAAPDMDAGSGRWFGLSVADARTLPFADERFDAIICSEVLEHIHDYKIVLGECLRLLKPGGQLAISVPRFFPEWLCWKLAPGYHQTPGGHVQIFKDVELRKVIEDQGFLFMRRHWAHGLHSPYWWLQCLVWPTRDSNWLVAQYRRFLEWDILKQPRLTRWMAAAADPLMGKSVVLYFVKAAR